MRSIIRTVGCVLGIAVGAAVSTSAVPAADYPERPIELIVPWGPGGGADQLARLVGKLMEPMLGRGVPVVNVAGATGATGMAKLLAAPADGYSMAVYIADSHALLAGKDARWSMNDIVPVAVMIQAPSFIFVAQESRFKAWGDFEKEARANPASSRSPRSGSAASTIFPCAPSPATASRSCRCRSPSRASATCRFSAVMPMRCTSRPATSPPSFTASRCARS